MSNVLYVLKILVFMNLDFTNNVEIEKVFSTITNGQNCFKSGFSGLNKRIKNAQKNGFSFSEIVN